MPAAPPPAPPGEACPLCGAPLHPEQEWCLRCGVAARTRLAASPNWKSPIATLAVVVALSVGVLAAALVKLAGATTVPATTSTVTTSAAAVAPTPTTTLPSATARSTVLPGTSASGTTASRARHGSATSPGAAGAVGLLDRASRRAGRASKKGLAGVSPKIEERIEEQLHKVGLPPRAGTR
jgi:hypothetical protein